MRVRPFLLLLIAAALSWPVGRSARGQGTVVTTLPDPLVMFSDFLTVLYPIDMNGDSVPDFTFGAETQGIALRTERANRLIVRLSPPPNIGGPAARLQEGFEVGSSLDPQLAWISSDPLGGYVDPGEIAFATVVQCLSTGCASDWPGGPPTQGFIGVQFELYDGLHYGYLDIVLSRDMPAAALIGWAYDSRPNTPIFASPVPEPSTSALLSAGGILFWFLGRRIRMA